MSGTYANYVTFNYILLYTLFYGKNGLFHVESRVLFPPTVVTLSVSWKLEEDEEEILTDDAHPSSPRGEGVAHQCAAGGDKYSTVQTEVT